ncbi:MAG: PQQ-binding-like beta-propeller repeat protein [Planctomycetes bacterium]|nr:PQQ-binding-like beta-propeller repeat protein [Planctomycetota bacterium]
MSLLGDTAISKRQAICLFAAWVIMHYCSSAHAQWPFVRGDAQATGVAQSTLPDPLEVVWKQTLDDSGFEATAVVLDGAVYLGDVDGTFYAFRLADGEILWQKKFPDSGFLAGAAIVDGRIYVGDFNGVVRALKADSGDEIWSYTATGEVYAAPNVYESQVLVTTEAGELISLDAKTGERRWLFEIEAPLRCWPAVVDNRVLLAGCDERLHVVDVANGKEVAGVDIDGPTGSTPAIFDGHVLFGTESGTFYSASTNPVAIRWKYQDPRRPQSIRTAAAVDRRTVIYGSQGKQLFALNPISGELQWKFAIRSNVESSPIIAGDRVILATKRGRLYSLDIATGEEQWKYEAGGSFLASPSVADGRLIIGNSDGTLYCFGKK